MRLFSKKAKYLILPALLVLLSGCKAVTGPDGKVLAEKIIYSTTTFAEMLKNDSWFTAIFVYPLAQVINFLTPYTGVVLAIVLCTVLVHLVTLPLTAKSTAGSQKLQMLQPEMDKINKKYEGKTDERSKLMQAQEMQALYSKHNLNPLSVLFGTFITLPIIIAMWQAVQRSYAVATGTFLGVDLQLSPIAGLKLGGSAAFIYVGFFVLMGIAQFVSMSLPKWMAKKKNAETRRVRSYDQPAQNNSMNVMTYSMLAMILFMGASWATAMSVYWLSSSVVTIAKTLLVQTQIVEKNK